MIIVKLTGGLGNQMFQYAAGRCLAHRLGVKLKLDISNFQYVNNRSYELHLLNVIEDFSTKEDVFRIVGGNLQYNIDRIFRTRYFVKSIRQHANYYRQPFFHFDEKFFDMPDNSYLEGYWQSERYFEDVREVLRKEFTFKNALTKENEAIAKQIRERNSISIHIRRSDYFYNSKLHKVHGLLRSEYYERALEKISTKVSDPHLYVFSDDMEWAKEYMAFNAPTTYVMNNRQPGLAHQDMELMSMCKHNITANSSFSWWGAWLNSNPDKMIVAPQKWFKTSNINTKDVIPDSWIRV